jgi:hypothetical protein
MHPVTEVGGGTAWSSASPSKEKNMTSSLSEHLDPFMQLSSAALDNVILHVSTSFPDHMSAWTTHLLSKCEKRMLLAPSSAAEDVQWPAANMCVTQIFIQHAWNQSTLHSPSAFLTLVRM